MHGICKPESVLENFGNGCEAAALSDTMKLD